MRMTRLPLAVLAALTIRTAGAPADDLLPPDRPVPAAVDHYLDARLKEDGVKPAPPADDATFLRRVTLDLAGRIPTAAELKEFLADPGADRRVRLVDRLLASPAFVRHQVNEFEVLLAGETRGGSLRPYLTR